MSIYLQTLASVQPRTSPPHFSTWALPFTSASPGFLYLQPDAPGGAQVGHVPRQGVRDGEADGPQVCQAGVPRLGDVEARVP